jgi:hypothetical protein
MSVSPVHSSAIWGSAANALSSPSKSLTAFKPHAGHHAVQATPSNAVSDQTLTALQQTPPQSGAFATDMMQALDAYRR